MSSEQLDNEIDLIELIEFLWDRKWLIAAITACFSVLSVGIALLLPASFEGSLRITALTKQQMAAYQTLNNTKGHFNAHLRWRVIGRTKRCGVELGNVRCF